MMFTQEVLGMTQWKNCTYTTLKEGHGTYTLVSVFIRVLQIHHKFSFWNHKQLLYCAMYKCFHIKISAIKNFKFTEQNSHMEPHLVGKEAVHFVLKNPTSTVIHTRTMYRVVEKFWMTGSMLYKSKIHKLLFLLDETWFTWSKHVKSQNDNGVIKISWQCMTFLYLNSVRVGWLVRVQKFTGPNFVWRNKLH